MCILGKVIDNDKKLSLILIIPNSTNIVYYQTLLYCLSKVNHKLLLSNTTDVCILAVAPVAKGTPNALA